MVTPLNVTVALIAIIADFKRRIILEKHPVSIGGSLIFLVNVELLVLGKFVRRKKLDLGLLVTRVVYFQGMHKLVMGWDHVHSKGLNVGVVELCKARIHTIVEVAHENTKVTRLITL